MNCVIKTQAFFIYINIFLNNKTNGTIIIDIRVNIYVIIYAIIMYVKYN